MNRANSILAIFLLMMAGCGGGRKSGSESDTFITIDVTKSYPKKELVLQGFMDVEYIALETRDGFYCQGNVRDIGNKYIIVTNRINDGYIYIFDRNGKNLSEFNRMGRGGEEYVSISGITLDEYNNVMLVDNLGNILVYDLNGKFIRNFPKWWEWNNIFDYDSEHWICKMTPPIIEENEAGNQQFAIISKQDETIE